MMFCSSKLISPLNLPWTESHFSKCARVRVSVRSLIARTRLTSLCDMARRTLHPIAPNFRVINASASGSTTEGGLRRLPPHLEHSIDIFILELGVNDAFNGIPVEQTRANLQSMIDQVKARNPSASMVIVGMQFP